jgi:hypothetical protein
MPYISGISFFGYPNVFYSLIFSLHRLIGVIRWPEYREAQSCAVSAGPDREFDMRVIFLYRDSIMIMSCWTVGLVFSGEGGGFR